MTFGVKSSGRKVESFRRKAEGWRGKIKGRALNPASDYRLTTPDYLN
jgi:hypothetical protein